MERATPDGRYAVPLRVIHWLVAALIVITVPIGLWMASRAQADLFDDLTNRLYSWHKLIGLTILTLAVVRVLVKASTGTPPYPASLSRAQVVAAKSLHHLLYVMLLLVPLTGWAGITAYGALDTVGGWNIPAMPFVHQDGDMAGTIFQVHKVAAITLAVLAIGHIGAALMHLVFLRDGVFRRIWFGRS